MIGVGSVSSLSGSIIHTIHSVPPLSTQVPHELVIVRPGSKKVGGTRHPDFLAKFPTATVPAIDDDGFLLAECTAILRYMTTV